MPMRHDVHQDSQMQFCDSATVPQHMSLQMTLALNVSPHSQARRCQSDAFLMRYALPEYKRDRTLPVSAGKSL